MLVNIQERRDQKTQEKEELEDLAQLGSWVVSDRILGARLREGLAEQATGWAGESRSSTSRRRFRRLRLNE